MLDRRHIPNAITLARVALTAVCIASLSMVSLSSGRIQPWLIIGLVTFVIAAATDWIDGYLARRWQVVSPFGRVMDPLADKMLILGTFIVLAGPGFFAIVSKGDHHVLMRFSASGVYPWMVVLMLTRELLVTGLRSSMEASGTAFGAVMLGKLKMVLQSITIPVVLILAANVFLPPWLRLTRDVLVYATVIATVLSAWPYLAAAVRSPRA
jgi:phosphatidylglycerophosphate synthase